MLDTKLTADQQELVFAQCERMTGKAGAAWLKSEFDIELSEQALGRWLEKRREDRDFTAMLSSVRADAERAAMVNKSLSGAGFTVAASTLISQCIFEELRKPIDKRNEGRIADLMGHALKARDQEIKADQNRLAREKFQFDAASAALVVIRDPKQFSALKSEINSATSESDQIAAVRRRLFGAASQKPEEAAA